MPILLKHLPKHLHMKNIKLLTAIVAASFVLFIGCKKEKESTDSSSERLRSTNQAAVRTSRPTPAALEKFNKLKALLPANFQKKFQENAKLTLKQHPEYRTLIRQALKLEASACNNNTTLNQWLGGQLSDWNEDVIYYVLATGMLDLPAYDALIFENSSANQRFGVNGEYTQRLTKTFKDLQRFWNIQTQNIKMVAMHGSTLTDRTKLIRTYRAAFGLSTSDAEFYADFVLILLDVFPQYRGGNHPIFTFNAFAQPSFNFPPNGVIPDKIVMGDGILEAYTAIGFGDVAPQAILAHEMGHHIQFQINLFTDENSPEATRRTELMADAYAAYYLSHSRGASMQWKRVQQFLQVFFNIGDCSFNSDGHHGTPTQRMAAAEWGYRVANNAQKQGYILTAQQFTALFEAELPRLVTY